MVRHKNRIFKKKQAEKKLFLQSKKTRFMRKKKKDVNNKLKKKERKKDQELNLNTIVKNQKRKPNNTENKEVSNKIIRKNVVNVIKKKYEESSSDGEDEDTEQSFMYKQLLNTFNVNQYSKSAVSSDEESEEGLEDDVDNQDILEEEEEDIAENGTESEGDDGLDNDEEEIEEDINREDEDSDKEDVENSDNDQQSLEEEEETALDEEEDEDNKDTEEEDEIDENEDDKQDPFVTHLKYDINIELLNSISNQLQEKHQKEWPILGQLIIQLPKVEDNSLDKSKQTILGTNEVYAKPHGIPTIKEIDFDKCAVKTQIQNNVRRSLMKYCKLDTFSPLQTELFSIINAYQDLHYPERNFKNSEEIRFMYCLHAVNHSLKTRLKVIHHNARLTDRFDIPDDFRDQGLVRPKVLIILPFKDSALKCVKMITSILLSDEHKVNIVNKKRFYDEFSGFDVALPRKNPHPTDYEKTFIGNTEDTFKIGLSITKKSLKLYADFYSADIIIASPLGIRMLIGAEGERNREYDFLASIELLILDQTELFLMQNWDHVVHFMDHLHLQPKRSHGTDFSRVRSWAVNGWTKYYRQTLVFSSLLLPNIVGLFQKKCHNYEGKVQVLNPKLIGTISRVVVKLPQVFHRIYSTKVQDAIDERFHIFVTKILPQYKPELMSHTVIYVPCYFDFTRIRNYMKKEDFNFVQICEYSKDDQIARARDLFFHAEKHFLLYSERFHFFRRIRLRGIRHIIFYQPPIFPHFYSEIINFMQEANQYRHENGGSETNMSVSVLYSKYDLPQLSAIVNTTRASSMLTSDNPVQMFMTGD